MNISLGFVRIFFVALCLLFMTIYSLSHQAFSFIAILKGVAWGIGLSSLFISFDLFFKRFNLRAFNITLLGLFLGYLMGQALVFVFDALTDFGALSLNISTLECIKVALLLFGCYLGCIMTLRCADELSISIPFIKLTPTVQKRKDLLIDLSLLSDPRIIDLAATGILDQQLLIPRFLIKELYSQSEMGEEQTKLRARKALEVIKKLEAHPTLSLRYNDTDFTDVKDQNGKLIRLARVLDCNILTADASRIQMTTWEGIRLINLHTLSNALKPLMQTAEQLKIKIQRLGKEPRQGIGYLEDGTMVVVNGGGNFIGEIIEAQVLSVKHTSSGRMIFCNAQDEEETHEYEEEYEE